MEQIGEYLQENGIGQLVPEINEIRLKRVLTYGTFDLFHYGHKRLLERASRYGLLIVGVSTDEFNEEKGKKTIMKYDERVEVLKGVRYVDAIIKEECWEQKLEDIEDYDVDILIMGDDWKGVFDYLPCKVIYLDRTERISTTDIKKRLKKI